MVPNSARRGQPMTDAPDSHDPVKPVASARGGDTLNEKQREDIP
jgi:hypothetical protein